MSEVTAGTIVGGKYRLDRPIGRGGMASVWQATHETLGSTVAVKLMDAFGSSRARLRKRFMREAQLAANLEHRNVVNILDYGVMQTDGQPYMVMELLRGQSLAERIESTEEVLTDYELVTIMAQLLSGLAAAHDAGIVHRDVKPENVFLVRDADGDYPKLLDFGISRNLADTDESRMTNTGMVVGTPLYMSPEQARGLKDIDERTDLWSVGMILYEALTGAAPFESENMGDILIQVATSDVPPLADLRPDVPPVLTDAIMRALEKDRGARWQDARSFRAALIEGADQLAAGQTVVPRPGRRPISSQVRVGGQPRSAAVWEDADTAIDPDTVKSADGIRAPIGGTTERVPRPAGRPALWYAVGGGLCLALLGLGGFFALGELGPNEVETAEPAATASPPDAPPTEAPSGSVSVEGATPVATAPVAELEPEEPMLDEPALDEPAVTEPATTEEPAARVAGAPAVEVEDEPAEPATIRRRRRGRRRGANAAGSASGSAREPATTSSSGRRGDFVRELDY